MQSFKTKKTRKQQINKAKYEGKNKMKCMVVLSYCLLFIFSFNVWLGRQGNNTVPDNVY